VKRNRWSAGVDAQTIAEVERLGVEDFLRELQTELQAGKYRPKAVLRRYIPKADRMNETSLIARYNIFWFFLIA
jgi:RNA-directed DNA polymerase